mmetsp:Transcript_34640/g.91120  ORF Transcript_34640/g.91120 Transcript_34640/m.91120 type:complete len:223 (+) Transcript_34640:262-930(+)
MNLHRASLATAPSQLPVKTPRRCRARRRRPRGLPVRLTPSLRSGLQRDTLEFEDGRGDGSLQPLQVRVAFVLEEARADFLGDGANVEQRGHRLGPEKAATQEAEDVIEGDGLTAAMDDHGLGMRWRLDRYESVGGERAEDDPLLVWAVSLRCDTHAGERRVHGCSAGGALAVRRRQKPSPAASPRERSPDQRRPPLAAALAPAATLIAVERCVAAVSKQETP